MPFYDELVKTCVSGRVWVPKVGGGTSGAPAGIAAARQGAKTLVIEHLHGLGGVGTLGMIGKYWYGNRVGFAAESPQNPIEKRMHFYLSELRKAGGEVWFGSLGC
ncbi:MAG: FAD-dependent oxidoreductase, partial [Clostridia bacterium]|nr:FAD-dependent oxidoreductase [Clostridia bacterium]